MSAPPSVRLGFPLALDVISQTTSRGHPRATIASRVFFVFVFLVGSLVCVRVCLSLGVVEREDRSQEFLRRV